MLKFQQFKSAFNKRKTFIQCFEHAECIVIDIFAHCLHRRDTQRYSGAILGKPVMQIGDPRDGFFLSHPQTHDRFLYKV